MSITNTQNNRLTSIDLVRGLVIMLMALDHVRMYFGFGTWYSEPTDLSTTTPLLFFTRWITHFCAPVFVFLAGTSASLVRARKANIREFSRFLLTRGVWLIFAELVIVNFAWTFDITYSFLILQVIWAIGVSMVVLSGLVFLSDKLILTFGLLLVFGHNLLDPIHAEGETLWDFLWYILHQPEFTLVNSHAINFVYPVLPWIGLMAIGYAFGSLYKSGFSTEQRRRWLFSVGIGAILLFIILRGFNFYGEPAIWRQSDSPVFTLMSFLNTTKYPPSLQFLLMTIGPALILLSVSEVVQQPWVKPALTFGKTPFFFYILHLYLIHALATLWLVFAGRDWHEYVFSAAQIRSGTLSNFGLGLSGVYLVWILVIVLLYPLCKRYRKYKENNPDKWWLSYI